MRPLSRWINSRAVGRLDYHASRTTWSSDLFIEALQGSMDLPGEKSHASPVLFPEMTATSRPSGLNAAA